MRCTLKVLSPIHIGARQTGLSILSVLRLHVHHQYGKAARVLKGKACSIVLLGGVPNGQ